MYTQCPDCATAFRVTAEVLKQAAGKVRCGGCGNAFNSLDFLSEQKPAQPPQRDDNIILPELKPELQSEDIEAPRSISAAQSAALLKTLDQLAGSDIRIEDTGVEWRVLDEDSEQSGIGIVAVETDAPEDDDFAASESPQALEMQIDVVDELLDNTPTPIDEFLTRTPEVVEAAEVFLDDAKAQKSPLDELRFDDNTPLPDDFDLDDESSYAPVTSDDPITGAVALGLEPNDDFAEPDAADITLSEPEEWQDLLGEFADLANDVAAPLERGESAQRLTSAVATHGDHWSDEPIAANDQRTAQDSPRPMDERLEQNAVRDVDVDVPLDVDTQFALQAEALGIDLSGMHKRDDDETLSELSDDVADGDAELSLADESHRQESDGNVIAENDVSLSEHVLAEDDFSDEDLADQHDTNAVAKESALDSDDDNDASQLALENATDDALDAARDAEQGLYDDMSDDAIADSESDDQDDARLDLSAINDVSDDSQSNDGAPLDESSIAALADDKNVIERSRSIDEALAQLEAQQYEQDTAELGEETASEIYVPPQTEDEQTINRMIDQDLLSMAVQDEDGFASTIVFANNEEERDAINAALSSAESASASANKLNPFTDTSSGFETIVMEGETVRGVLDADTIAAKSQEAAEISNRVNAIDADSDKHKQRTRHYGLVAGIAALVIVLLIQVVHQSRAAWATIPAFNNAVGPIYRALGQPLQPEWNIAGWVFEASRHIDNSVTSDDAAVETEDAPLTIYSRVGNQSDEPLPYPLIGISLKDRFEETIGSHLLTPADYLSEGLDPRKPVQPGASFEAVIEIDTPAASATGFKLTACYRQPDDKLRCAIDDFK